LVRKTAAYEVLKKLANSKKKKDINIKILLKEESDVIHKNMEKLGNAVVKELNISSLPKEIIKLIGRLNYRTSFGQNILMHSLEVAYFARMLASELGADIEVTTVAALLHDLGKSVDQDIEGSHDELTKQILEKYNVDPRIVHAAYNHHDAEEMGSVEARLVQASDAMSASRPGARNEAGEQYIERIKALEETAINTEGVIKAYAIQAGREIRSYVDPDKISDENMLIIAKDMAKRIEENVQYPGQVMVKMIRELKITEHAK
jgi:ribonucrease Y